MGALPPLKIPNQTGTSNPEEIKKNEIREAVVVRVKGQKGVDIGIGQIINYYTNFINYIMTSKDFVKD